MSSYKTGRLTKVEKFYIDNNLEMSVSDVAKDLNRTKKIVEKRRSSNEPSKGHITKANHYPKTKTINDLMGHKESRGVTIMTPEASEVADATRAKRLSEMNIADRHKGSIHIIKEDK
ncbi:hypothetical protein CL634_07675 [bacterium]|nr:hypothetical protein [bacterium]